ncbi:hypothetical protein ADL26_17840, partial [Thermoactinomyces vulgaris]
LLEGVPVLVGDAEHLADDERGHGEREVAHEVGLIPIRPHRGDAGVDDGLDARLKVLHALDGEHAGHLAAQTGVLGRVVEEEEPRRDLLGDGDEDVRELGGRVGEPLAGGEPGVREDL